MKALLISIVDSALRKADIPYDTEKIGALITVSDNLQRGDYSSPLALSLHKNIGKEGKEKYPRPLDLAQVIANHCSSDALQAVSVSEPGYINFKLSADWKVKQIISILKAAHAYGTQSSKNKSVLIEYLSANPTGPLHVGRARGGIVGMALANILKASGFTVTQEYYVNDGGKQIDILLLSVIYTFHNKSIPEGGYDNDYVKQLATFNKIATSCQEQFNIADCPDSSLEEQVSILKDQTSPEHWYDLCSMIVAENIGKIREDLLSLGIQFDNWVYESKLISAEKLTQFLLKKQSSDVYKDDTGALWFRSTDYSDDKDRVLIRNNGAPTYFAYDLYYHLQKLKKHHDVLINVWGSDHHGYVSRLTSALKQFSGVQLQLTVLLVQFVVLKNKEGIISALSTRAGTAVPLSALLKEIGGDVAKVYYLLRSSKQHMEFDLKQARTMNQQNPYYYLQYAHARCVGIFNQAQAKKLLPSTEDLCAVSSAGDCEHSTLLINILLRFPDIIEESAASLSAHTPLGYLRELASAFHNYYNEVPILCEDKQERNANLLIVKATQQVLANGLALYAIKPLDRM